MSTSSQMGASPSKAHTRSSWRVGEFSAFIKEFGSTEEHKVEDEEVATESSGAETGGSKVYLAAGRSSESCTLQCHFLKPLCDIQSLAFRIPC